MDAVVGDKFFAFLRSTSLVRGWNRDHVYLGHSYGRNCLLLGWSHQPYREAITVIREKQPDVSDKAVGKALTQSMVKLFHQHYVRRDADHEADAPTLQSILPGLDSSAVTAELSDLLDRLKSQIKAWTAFVFLEGVALSGLRSVPLGVATLYPKDRGPLTDALAEMDCIKLLDDVTAWVRDSTGHCRSYLTVGIEGERSYADDWAHRQAQHVVSVLNMYTVSARHRASFYERIGVLGQPTTVRGQLVVKRTPPVGKMEPPPQYSCYGQSAPGRHHVVDRAAVDGWREAGLDKVVHCLQLPETKPGSAESRIRNAITWYGRAMNAHTDDEQFVGLTIALESLLVAGERVSKAQRLADVASSLLGSDFRTRESIAARTKELYDVRGRVVHEGVPVSHENLYALDEIVAGAILAFVRRETGA